MDQNLTGPSLLAEATTIKHAVITAAAAASNITITTNTVKFPLTG